MQTIITISIFITELLTMLVLGFVVLAACAVLYDHLKKSNKEIKNEKDFGGKEK